MPRDHRIVRTRAQRVPSYRHHRPSGQAVVTLGGKDHYLGRFDSPESRAEYDRLIATWRASGGTATAPPDVTTTELCVKYIKYANTYYRKDGRPTSQLDSIKRVIKDLRDLCGAAPACEFRPS